MTTIAQAVRDYIQLEPTLYQLMTGGMYTWDETGRLGINYTTVPQAFNRSRLMPCLAVKIRGLLPTKDIRDEDEQIMSYIRNGQIFIYQEGGTDAIEEATQLVYNMLHDREPIDGVRCMFGPILDGRQEESLNGASMTIINFSLFGLFEPISKEI